MNCSYFFNFNFASLCNHFCVYLCVFKGEKWQHKVVGEKQK